MHNKNKGYNMKTDIIFRTEHLRKYFGPVHAVEDVSLEVRQGEVYGFLGPNGAGKTTTIGMALGLIHPTAGHIELFGEAVTPSQSAILGRVGAVVGASPSLIPFLTARQNVENVGRLHPGVTPQRLDETLELVGISKAANRKAGHFSTGMKQRLGLAMALIHKPDLLILDEPTNGMDPAGMREVRNLLCSLAEEGTTVFVSSHLLHEIEQICSRVAVLNKGVIVAQGPVNELIGSQQIIRVRVPSPKDAGCVLNSLAGVKEIETDGSFVSIKGSSSEQVITHLTSQGIIPSEVTTSQANLESLFLKLTQETA
jgi:ABC-2 type transport system ATP-binding protein